MCFVCHFFLCTVKGGRISCVVFCAWQRWPVRAWVRVGTGVSQLSYSQSRLELAAVAATSPALFYGPYL